MIYDPKTSTDSLGSPNFTILQEQEELCKTVQDMCDNSPCHSLENFSLSNSTYSKHDCHC